MTLTSQLSVVVADDEALARRRTARLLREKGCTVLAECGSAEELIAWSHSDHPTVQALFLDIQMPGLTGLEVVSELDLACPVVFVTAHTQYAIQAFEAEAFDYLLKPISEARLARTLQRLQQGLVQVRSAIEVGAAAQRSTLKVPVRAGDGTLLLDLRKVTHFEVSDEIVHAYAGDRFRTPWTALSEVEEAFPGDQTLRIQRHVLVRLDAVVGLRSAWNRKGMVMLTGGRELETTRAAFGALKERFGLRKGADPQD